MLSLGLAARLGRHRFMGPFIFPLIISVLIGGGATGDNPKPPATPIEQGLQLRYDFSKVTDGLIKDSSVRSGAADLEFKASKKVRQGSDGLEILSSTLIRTKDSPKRMVGALKRAGTFSLSAWIRPANLKQAGPARILTLSRNSGERNLTLGQDGDRIEVRLRTTKTSENGIPGVRSQSKKLNVAWMHVAFTFAASGNATLFVNGQIDAQESLGGNLTNWNEGYSLGIGNELSNDRPWLGAVRSMMIHDRVLSPAEVLSMYKAGVDSAAPTAEHKLAMQVAENKRLFETKIAPLLAAHCLECHDPATKQGGLDLSRKQVAFAGGDSGPAISLGKAHDSLIWSRVVSDEMPEKRDPLTAAEKGLLKQWLDGGAQWSLDFIDAAVYERSAETDKIYLQRLTVPEYIETVRSVLGVDIADEATQTLPRDIRADGFSNTAYNLTVDLAHIEAYAKLAEIAVSRVDVAKLVRQFTKSRELTDENVTTIIEPMGRRLLRGPLTKKEVIHYCGVSTSVAAAGGSIEEAVQYILEAMLQSPRFIYRVEHHAGSGELRALNPFELASRLSYILWGGPPDDNLLTAAEKGQLDAAAVERQTQRMLEDPRAVARSRQFFSEWLNLGGLNNLRPDKKKFPQWDSQLAGDMQAETLTYFEDVVWRESRPLSDLLNAPWTFVTPRLARHYGLPMTDALTKAEKDQMVRYDLSKLPARGGVLTQGSVLTKGGDNASMVTRGLFVMHELLRGVVHNPPPCVDTTPKPSRPGLSQRMISEQRLASESCVGCHVKFEPLAFGLERFDGLGSYHEYDEFKNPLRADGEILFPGDEHPTKFESSGQLMQILADSDRVRQSLTWKVTQFALGRPLDAADAGEVARIHRISQEKGGRYRDVMAAIATSDLVRQTRTEP